MHVMRVGKSNFLKGWLSATVLACSVALAGQPSAVPPAELVRRAVQNEIGENGGSNPRFMFKDERKAAHLWQTKLLVETSEAIAGMLIAQDGHSLTPQQMLAEDARLGDQLVRVKFWPNPNYEPPSRVEQVLTGMRGHLLIDSNASRIAEIDGALEKDVSFGWGILGHLDRGGRFLVRQADVGNHQWEITHMELAFTGKILWVKKL